MGSDCGGLKRVVGATDLELVNFAPERQPDGSLHYDVTFRALGQDTVLKPLMPVHLVWMVG